MSDLLTMQNDYTDIKTPSRLLLQCNRINLQHYVKQGIITPDKYLAELMEKDIQSKHPDYIALADGYVDELNESQVLVEIALSNEEKKELHVVGNVYFYQKPLPISRIKKIYVESKEIQKHIITNLRERQNGFLPDGLFDVWKKSKKHIGEKVAMTSPDVTGDKRDFTQELAKFDKLLGMFAFMKNANIYYANRTGIVSNYSDNYFAILQKLNPVFGYEKESDFNLKQHEDLYKLVYSDNQMDDDYIQNLIEKIEDSEIKSLFENMLEDPNITLKILAQLRGSEYFYTALIYYFKNKQSDKKDSFKLDIEKFVPLDRLEYSLAFLGIYYGYTALRSNEAFTINDANLRDVAIQSNNMKFRLDSKLDFFTIESVFAKSFGLNIQNNDFSYLCFLNKKPLALPKDKNFATWYEVLEDRVVVDEKYIKIRKKSVEEVTSQSLDKYGQEIRFGSYLLSFVAKYFKKIISYSKDGNPTEPYCKTEELKENIKTEQNSKKLDELFRVFELDGK